MMFRLKWRLIKIMILQAIDDEDTEITSEHKIHQYFSICTLFLWISLLIHLFWIDRHHHHHHHHNHRHNGRKKRHKRKILVHDLDEQVVKVKLRNYPFKFLFMQFNHLQMQSDEIASNFCLAFAFRFLLSLISCVLNAQVVDPEDMSQRARWTIIATACLLLLMCLLLVGITLRMAPLIDDMGKSNIHYSPRFQSLKRNINMCWTKHIPHATF